jgi:hypothetical protein
VPLRGTSEFPLQGGDELRRPRAAFFRRLVEEVVAAVSKQHHARGGILTCETGGDECRLDQRIGVAGGGKDGAELGTEALGRRDPYLGQKRAPRGIAVIHRADRRSRLLRDRRDGGASRPEPCRDFARGLDQIGGEDTGRAAHGGLYK